MATILIYPILVLVVLLLIMVGASLFIVPMFIRVYDQVGAELPWLTRVSVQAAMFLYSPIGLVLVLALLAVALYTLYAVFTDRLSSRYIEVIPGVRNLVYLSDTAIMTEFIGHMVDRGVPLPDACRAASTVVYNQNMRSSLEKMAEESERGASSADKLNPRIPATAAWLYRQGESRGTLGETCKSIASYCESRFELLSRRTLYLIEPAFILIISILIGLVVISFYLPLFNLPRVMI